MTLRRRATLAALALAVGAAGYVPAAPAAGPPSAVVVQAHIRALDDGTLWVSLSALTKLPVSAYRWSFGDRSAGAVRTSTEQRPSHVYLRGRTYVVRVTLMLRGGRSIQAQRVLRL